MDIRSELYSTNDFTFAVAVILSAQATDKKVNEVTPALFRVAGTPRKMLELGQDGLKKHIRVISFFNNSFIKKTFDIRLYLMQFSMYDCVSRE